MNKLLMFFSKFHKRFALKYLVDFIVIRVPSEKSEKSAQFDYIQLKAFNQQLIVLKPLKNFGQE